MQGAYVINHTELCANFRTTNPIVTTLNCPPQGSREGGGGGGQEGAMPVQVESIMAGDGKHYPYERQTVTLHYVGYLDRAGER